MYPRNPGILWDTLTIHGNPCIPQDNPGHIQDLSATTDIPGLFKEGGSIPGIQAYSSIQGTVDIVGLSWEGVSIQRILGHSDTWDGSIIVCTLIPGYSWTYQDLSTKIIHPGIIPGSPMFLRANKMYLDSPWVYWTCMGSGLGTRLLMTHKHCGV